MTEREVGKSMIWWELFSWTCSFRTEKRTRKERTYGHIEWMGIKPRKDFLLVFTFLRSLHLQGPLFTGLNPAWLTDSHSYQPTHSLCAIGDLVTPSQCVMVWMCSPSLWVGNLIHSAKQCWKQVFWEATGSQDRNSTGSVSLSRRVCYHENSLL